MGPPPVDRRLRVIVIVTVAAVIILATVAGLSRLVHPPPGLPVAEPTPARGPTASPAAQPCRSGQPGQRSSQAVAGTITGGGLAFPATDGWEPQDQVHAVPFGYDVGIETQWHSVEQFSYHAVARVSRADFPGTARQVARRLVGCVATTHRYAGGTADEVTSGRYDVSGQYGWQITTRLRPAGDDRPGEVLTVVVVDVGDPDWLAVCLATSAADDGDADTLRRAVTAGLTWIG